jgi:hypothetical protein
MGIAERAQKRDFSWKVWPSDVNRNISRLELYVPEYNGFSQLDTIFDKWSVAISNMQLGIPDTP